MEMKQLLEKCREQAGISVLEHENTTELVYQNGEDNGSMEFIPLLLGITAAFIRIRSRSWPAPDLTEVTPAGRGLFIINYCVSGRCELLLNDDSYVYVTDNQASLSENYARNSYIYPSGLYDGIEFFIDREAVEQDGTLRRYLSIDMTALAEKYCQDMRTYIAMAEPELKNEFMTLWKRYEEAGAQADAEMKISVLQILALLLKQPVQELRQACTFYTKAQVTIAKEVREILSADLTAHYSARKLAERYAISESSLKNYFRGVYGRNISEYRNELRMKKAAELLCFTRLSVLEIAMRTGYQNQSKFAAAFKRTYAMSPREYRLKNSLATPEGKSLVDDETSQKYNG